MQDRVPRTVAIETHGCKLNLADSEVLARRFALAGFRVVGPDEEADIYLVNTCTVTRTADHKARQALRQAHRRLPNAVLIATGCYAHRASQELAGLPGVSLVAGNTAKDELVGRILSYQSTTLVVPCSRGQEGSQPHLPNHTRAFVKIQEGCNQVCAYCIVPKVRGRERSIPPDRIVQEVKTRVDQGYQEVVLTGTQLGSYGFDLPGTSLQRLVECVLCETAVPRLRISSLQPQEMAPGLLQLWQQDSRLCPHFHMPLQSGSNVVLARMRRRYSTELYAEVVQRLRETIPGAAITTDIIVGFPGETEGAFEETLRFCERMGFAAIHAFPYSARPGTSAAYFPNQVEEETQKKRISRLLGLGNRLASQFRRSALGQDRPVLWEKARTRGGIRVWSGLTDNYLRVCTSFPGELANRITIARLVSEQEAVLWARVPFDSNVSKLPPGYPRSSQGDSESLGTGASMPSEA